MPRIADVDKHANQRRRDIADERIDAIVARR
jgi:hypothetical protein